MTFTEWTKTAGSDNYGYRRKRWRERKRKQREAANANRVPCTATTKDGSTCARLSVKQFSNGEALCWQHYSDRMHQHHQVLRRIRMLSH